MFKFIPNHPSPDRQVLTFSLVSADWRAPAVALVGANVKYSACSSDLEVVVGHASNSLGRHLDYPARFGYYAVVPVSRKGPDSVTSR